MLKLQKKPLFIIASLLLNTPSLLATENNHYNLSQAIQQAVDFNPNLQIMQERIAQAENQLGIALANFYPTIKAGLSYGYSDNPSRAFGMIIAQRELNFSPSTDFNHPQGISNYRPEIKMNYSLFRGGQDYYQTKSAQLNIENAELAKKATHNQLIQAVSVTFYSYLAAIETDKIAIRSIEAIQSELKQSNIRYHAGAILRSDVLSLEVKLAEAQGIKIQTHNTIEQIKTNLKSLLGLHSQEFFEIDLSDHWDTPELIHSFDELLQLALQQRPEIQQVNKQIKIAQQQLRIAQGAYLPTANAYVAYGSDSQDLEFNSQIDNISVGVTLEVDIFSGFRHQETIKKAEHQLTIHKKMAQQTQLNIEKSVKLAHLKLLNSLARLKITTISITAAEEAFRLVSEQRKAGIATITRYIEANVARDTTHARNITAHFDTLKAEIDLKQAIGNLNSE